MSVTGMLCWFDEPVDLLRQATRGSHVFCDRLVAADGGYELIPGTAAESPPEQAKTIREAADEVGLEIKFLEPKLWSGQVEKREAVLQEAKRGSDWVMPIDADYRFTGNREQIAPVLQRFHEHGVEQVTLDFLEPSNNSRPISLSAATDWHANEADQWRMLPLIYRVQPEMHYERFHWFLHATRADGVKINLFGGQEGTQPALTAHLDVPHMIEHLCLFRSEEEVLRNRAYCEARDQQIETVGYEA